MTKITCQLISDELKSSEASVTDCATVKYCPVFIYFSQLRKEGFNDLLTTLVARKVSFQTWPNASHGMLPFYTLVHPLSAFPLPTHGP